MQRVVARQGSPAGLENLTPHVLRHTFAKNLVDAGVGRWRRLSYGRSVGVGVPRLVRVDPAQNEPR